MTSAAESLDGRRLRRTANREAVLDAMAELFREGCYQPSSAEIAERAGLSPRSLFRYFVDIDDLNRAAIERQLAVARPLLGIEFDLSEPLAERVAALVAARVRLHEEVAHAARAVRANAPSRPVVAAQLHESRRYLRRELERVLAAELAVTPVLPAIDSLCSVESYDLMRTEHGMTPAQIAASLTAALTALLS